MAQTDVRPRCADEDADTKRRLVAAATDEFFACGYSGASLRQICSRAGVTTGALYFFFENKQDLLRSVIDPLAKGALELLGEDGPYGPESPYATGVVSRDYERESGVLHKITGEFFRQRRLVSIVLSNRDNVVVAGFLADVCQLIKKNTRAHVPGMHRKRGLPGRLRAQLARVHHHRRRPGGPCQRRGHRRGRPPHHLASGLHPSGRGRLPAPARLGGAPSAPIKPQGKGRPARSADFSPGGPR